MFFFNSFWVRFVTVSDVGGSTRTEIAIRRLVRLLFYFFVLFCFFLVAAVVVSPAAQPDAVQPVAGATRRPRPFC